MVEQQDQCAEGAPTDISDENKLATLANGDRDDGSNGGGDRVNANSTLRDTDDEYGAKHSNAIAQSKHQTKQSIELSPISRSSDKPASETAATLSDAQQQPNADDEDEWELVPPDGGWGWLVLAGSMLVNILVPGTVKSFGVLFVEFLEAFNASPAAAAWIPALCYFLYSSLGPLSSILSVKYSYRTVTLIGGTFAAVGMMMSYFASSVTYLYISYGLMVGTGAGLSFPPTVYIVTSYFVRLRGLANGICISGSAFGSIILPPILRYLLENFSYRGAVLIMGAITLNTWVAALFYEPVENHMKRVLKKKKPLDENSDSIGADGLAIAAPAAGPNDIIEEEDEGIFVQCTATPNDDAAGPGTSVATPKFTITSDDTSPPMSVTPTRNMSSGRLTGSGRYGTPGFVRSASAAVVQTSSRSGGDGGWKVTSPIREGVGGGASEASFAQQLSSTPSLYAVPEGSRYSQTRLNRMNQLRTGKPKRSPSTSSFQYVSTPYHGSTLSFQPQEFSSHLSLRSIASSINPVSACSKSKDTDANGAAKKSGETKFLDLSLLRDPAYLVILISNSTNAIGYTNFIILLPAYAMALDFDKNLAAYLLSIVSVFDLVGRIGGSALSDWTVFIPKTWYFVGGLALSGFSLAALPQASSYLMVSFWCGLFGLASGTYVGITAVIMADMLGTERLTSTYGISLFVNGILQLVGPPLCGVWLSQMKTYVPLFTALGIVLMCGASLWGFMPFIHRNRRLKEEARVARLAFVDEAEIAEQEKELLA